MLNTFLNHDAAADENRAQETIGCACGPSCGFRGEQCLCRAIVALYGAQPPSSIYRLELATGQSLRPASLPSNSVIAVLEGIIGLDVCLSDGRRSILALFFAGDYLDLHRFDRQVDGEVTALTHVRLQVMEQSSFDSLLGSAESIRSNYMRLMSEAMHRQFDHANDLAKKTPMERVAAFLFEIRDRPHNFSDSNDIVLPFGRREIADYLGLQPETLSRALTSLIAEGAICLPETNLAQIVDFRLLRQIANGARPRRRAQ